MDNNLNNNASIPNPLANNMPVNNNMSQANNNQVVNPQPMVQPQPIPTPPVTAPNNNQPNVTPTPVVEESTQGISVTPQMSANAEANHLNDMNVNGTYNHMDAPPEYVNDQQVKENIVAPKKNTVPISKELKTVFIIALVLLVFIIVMPLLFDLLNNIRFH